MKNNLQKYANQFYLLIVKNFSKLSILFLTHQIMPSTPPTTTPFAPFKTMKAIYVYIAALIGLIVVSAGIYGFLEYLLSLLFLNAEFNAAYIVTPLSKIITGLFIMIPHWGIGHHFHLLECKRKK